MRLIDADKLKLGLCRECSLYPKDCLKEECDWNSIAHINMEPTVEAIPVWFVEKKIKELEDVVEKEYRHHGAYEKCEAWWRVTELKMLLEEWKDR